MSKRKPPRAPGLGKRGPLPGQGGRPRVELTAEQERELRMMAEIGATRWEMAIKLGIDENTLAARIADTSSVKNAIETGSMTLRTSLRRKRVQIALDDEHPAQAAMLRELKGPILGESDKLTLKIDKDAEAIAVLREAFPELDEDHCRALLTGDDDEDGAVH